MSWSCCRYGTCVESRKVLGSELALIDGSCKVLGMELALIDGSKVFCRAAAALM